MNVNSNLGMNIKALRKAFGETQDDLANYLMVEKNTISNYENGKREPNKEMLNKISKHFMVSVEELLFTDLTNIGRFDIDPYSFWKYLNIIFPIKASEKAMKNIHFKKAITCHKALYEDLHDFNMDNLDKINCFDHLEDCYEYMEAFDDENVILEAEIDFLAIWFLTVIIVKIGPQVFRNKTAAISNVVSKDIRFGTVIDGENDSWISELEDLSKEFDDPEMRDIINNIFIHLKHSSYSDLADYYLALKYYFFYIDNELGFEFNRRIGTEMLNTFTSVGNEYAERFLIFCRESMGDSSQNVD